MLALMGFGSICGSLFVAYLGNISRKGQVALGSLICLGRWDLRVRSFEDR